MRTKSEKMKVVRIRSAQDFAAGLFMIGVAVVALFLCRDLPTGTLQSIGAGFLPKTFAVICIGLGVLLLLRSIRYEGDRLSGWSWRGVIFILGGICLFGLTIRGAELGPIKIPELGMLVAGPLVVIVAGLAATDVKIKELTIFAVAITAACALLFKVGLKLPIPLAPWLLGM